MDRDINQNQYSYYTSELDLMGFETEINVINSQEDTTPVQIVDYSYTPNEVDLTEGESDITFSYIITDDLSGIEIVHLYLINPSGNTYPISLNCNGTLECIGDIVYTFDEFSESGTWLVHYIWTEILIKINIVIILLNLI